MDRFDHVQVMNSLLIGLGITNLLTDFGVLLERQSVVEWYLPHTIWVAIALVCSINAWWIGWTYRSAVGDNWDYRSYMLVLFTGVSIYMVDELALPNSAIEVSKLKVYFHTTQVWFYLMFGLFLSCALVLRRQLQNIPFLDKSNFIRFVAILVALIACVCSVVVEGNVLADYAIAFSATATLVLFNIVENPARLVSGNSRVSIDS